MDLGLSLYGRPLLQGVQRHTQHEQRKEHMQEDCEQPRQGAL